jgi:hypothetical protein
MTEPQTSNLLHNNAQPQRRRIYESIFNKAVPWSPLKSYLLGQFKAGGNIQRKGDGFNITSVDLHQIIKMQIWLRSNHKIYLNFTQKKNYKKGSPIFGFHVRRALMLSDLRRLGFLATHERSAKLNAPIPADMPKNLIAHFLRGFLDERGHPALQRNKPRYRINYAVPEFLREVIDILEGSTGIKGRKALRTIHTYKDKNGCYVLFDGKSTLQKIFNYLYLSHPIPLGLFNQRTYMIFCKVLGFDSQYEKINLYLDIKSLYVLHAVCSENGIDPNTAIAFNMPRFLKYCQANNLISNRQEQLIKYGKNVSARFCGTDVQIDWQQAFENISKILGMTCQKNG